jgi:hypothetical protein
LEVLRGGFVVDARICPSVLIGSMKIICDAGAEIADLVARHAPETLLCAEGWASGSAAMLDADDVPVG